ncbi:MAG: Type II secretion system protein F [Candidatus Anoxychlamydiales bacterium]|nr:Type II secretion system protein F [Candidatus Anoxychlamydiales bacterium]
MALYEYFALSKSGKKIKKVISATSFMEAKSILELQKIAAYKISKISGKKIFLSKKEVLYFFEQLKNMLLAGLALYESLLILAEKEEKKKIKLLILDLSENIKMGLFLSDAMKKHPKTFDTISISMIETAQKTGALSESLNEIIKILTSSMNLKTRLISAFTYPAVLLTFCMVVLNFLLFITIPSLSDLFEDRKLHPFTKMVFAISKFAVNSKFFIFLAVVGIICVFLLMYFYKPFRKKIIEKLLNLPILKSFLIKVALIRFSISFSNLLKGGQSYVNAITLAINILKHQTLENEFLPIKDKLIEGEKLSTLLKDSENIPPMVSKMISIAEETSEMPKMLSNIAKIYEEEVDRFLSKISSIVQPVLLVILGLIIGFVVLSILIPLTDVSSFIGE